MKYIFLVKKKRIFLFTFIMLRKLNLRFKFKKIKNRTKKSNHPNQVPAKLKKQTSQQAAVAR